MPATSEKQANLFKMVVAYKKGELDKNSISKKGWEKVKKIARGISMKDAEDMMKVKGESVFNFKRQMLEDKISDKSLPVFLSIGVIISDINNPKQVLIFKKVPKYWDGWGFITGPIDRREIPKQAIKELLINTISIDYTKVEHELLNLDLRTEFVSVLQTSKQGPGEEVEFVGLENWYAVRFDKDTIEDIILFEEEWSDFKWVKIKDAFRILNWSTHKKALHKYLYITEH